MASGIFTLRNQLQGLITKAWTGTQKTNFVEYLVVAGGGGAGYSIAGAGGAGGLLQGVLSVPTGTSLTVTIGGGGAGATSTASPGSTGQNSVFSSITAFGGGGGGSESSSSKPTSGGSGGGSSYTANSSIGQGTFGQGNAGGSTSSTGGPNYSAGGGGGAGTVGLNGTSTSGNGGAGIASAINGTVTTYAGGGGGGGYTGYTTSAGTGGVGGGGNGSLTTTGGSGTANTGGGGGGGGNNYVGGTGGSGIVIISYPDIYAAPTFGGANSPTASTSGSGSLSFNGSSQYVATSDTSNVGSGSFTIEAWVYFNSLSSSYAIFDEYNGGSTNSWQLYVSSSHLNWFNGSTSTTTITGSATLSTNTWYHIVAVRNGTTLKTYVNGVQDGTVTDSTNYNASASLWIGSQRTGGPVTTMNGYITNARIVLGTAVYTSAFTPPTTPLTAISGTNYLLSAVSGAPFADGSGNGYNATNTSGIPTWNQLSPFATGLGYKNRVYTWTGSGTVTF